MAKEYRFVVDINVGRLATWLRVMGYDTVFPAAAQNQVSDNDLVRIALGEDRVLVTRDAGFSLRRAARQGQMRVVHIVDDGLQAQLRQLVRELDLDSQGGFSRCVICNELLNFAAKTEVAHRVPPYVYQSQRSFMECPPCRRVYWRGTHWSSMVSRLDQVIQGAR